MTWDRLKIVGVQSANRCQLFEREEKTNEQLLFDWSYSLDVAVQVMNKLDGHGRNGQNWEQNVFDFKA